MEFGRDELNRKDQMEYSNSRMDFFLENVKKMVEWKEVTDIENKLILEKVSVQKIVSDAWKESNVECFRNNGIRFIENYVAVNYQKIVLEIKDSKPGLYLSKLSEIAEKLNISDLVQTVIYFHMWKYNIASSVLGYIGELADTEVLSILNVGGINYAKEISTFYKDIITPDYIKKYCEGEEIADVEKFIAKLTEVTEEGIVAACYLSCKLMLGVGEVVEDALDYVIAAVAKCVCENNVTEKIFSRSFTRELANEIESKFTGNEHIKDAGKMAEKIGEIGTYIGLTMVATSTNVFGAIPLTAVVGANVMIGFARAGNTTRYLSEISGKVGNKELLCGLGAGMLSVVCIQLVKWINGKINISFAESIKTIHQSGEDMAGVKILLEKLKCSALEGGIGGGIFSLKDVYEDVLISIFDDGENVNWKKVLSDVGISTLEGAAIGVLFYSVGETIKDVTDMKNYEGNLSWKECIKIKLETGWDNDIIKCIKDMQQYDIYKNADLHQEEILGRLCLCKKIDMDYVSPKTIDDRNPNGLSNRELMRNGRVPYDAKTGERIELHHMGQAYDSPFAELLENSEHGDGKDTILHDKGVESWRRDPQLKNAYNNIDRPGHWQERVNS